MRVSIPFLASGLKKDLISFGVDVLMCKKGRENNAVLAIEGSVKNVNLFLDFCKNNDFAGPCGLEFRGVKVDTSYINVGNIFKYAEV